MFKHLFLASITKTIALVRTFSTACERPGHLRLGFFAGRSKALSGQTQVFLNLTLDGTATMVWQVLMGLEPCRRGLITNAEL